MKKFFTLIELITVIVVLGILAAIVIPNISSFKEEAKETAVLADARNIQTAVDLFGLDYNGTTPTKNKPTVGNPEIIELYALKPNYLRDTPKENGAKFWLDSNNVVWASMVDSPMKVEYDTGTLSWNTVDGAVLYKIYKSNKNITSTVSKSKGMTYIDEVIHSESQEPFANLPELTEGTYLVTAVDQFGFESAPTKDGTSYAGYGEGPSKDFVLGTNKVIQNKKPIAVISMNPESNLTTSTTIVWSHANSTDPENHAISNVEWKLNNTVVDVMPSKLSLGIHKVDLRVQDEKGLWSDTVSQEITINEAIFSTGTFTNAGATGRFGPTKDQLDNAYLMTDLKGKVYLEQIGIQLWEVPQSGRYKLEVYGSQGGSNAVTAGGKGAIISGEFTLNKHDVLKILVGQTGDAGASYDNYASGAPTRAGGGGTFIWQSTSATPLIVAGGGGGAGSVILGGDALSTQGTKHTSGYYAAGWSYNGVAGYNTSIALSPLNGGTGGRQDSDSTLFQTHGGFGGGTGSAGSSVYEFGGGGGGGYHGGAGLRGSKLNGLGGSSYNTGINQSNTVGNTGHGKAIITYLGQ